MRRLICSVLSFSLPVMPVMPVMGASLPAFAAPPSDVSEGDSPTPTPPPDEDMIRAQQLFESGVARYSAADYDGAIEFWLDAYALIPPTFDNRLVKAELIYNVARAHQKSFEIGQDVTHLRQARKILHDYLKEVDDLYPPEQVGLERQKVEEQIAELDRAIYDAEAEAARREAELAERMRPKFDEQADAREHKRNNAILGSGAALSVIGLGAVGMLVAGVAMAGDAERAVETLPLATDIPERRLQVSKGQTGNALMLLGGLVGSVFLAAGVPLFAVGLASESKRKQRRRKAGLEAAGPMLMPGGGGVMLGGRF